MNKLFDDESYRLRVTEGPPIDGGCRVVIVVDPYDTATFLVGDHTVIHYSGPFIFGAHDAAQRFADRHFNDEEPADRGSLRVRLAELRQQIGTRSPSLDWFATPD